MMLVPADAKRCMATMETGRVSRVKVLKITSIDETENYTWAQSTVDPDFYYEVGKWLEPANGFQEDRWKDSSPGIHFFLDRQQCVDYQSKYLATRLKAHLQPLNLIFVGTIINIEDNVLRRRL